MEDFELSKGALFSHEWKWIRALTIMLWQPPIILHWGRPQTIIAMVSSRLPVKMTLRSAARPRRALTGHSAGIFVSLHSLRFHLWFTLSTLPIHLVISYSHTFHLSVTWSARCPVTDSQRTGQGLEASFHKTLNSLLDFKSAPQMLYLCKSHTFHFNAIPYP